MKQNQLLLTLTTFCLLVTGLSGYYTCTETTEGNRKVYKDAFSDYIDEQTNLVDLRRLANESLNNITMALAGWQDEVVGDLGPYLDKIDTAINDFEKKYDKQYVQCTAYTDLMDVIYQGRSSIQYHISRIFSYDVKNWFQKEENRKTVKELDKMITKCDNKDEKKQDDCLKRTETVDEGKKLLRNTRMHCCMYVNLEVEKIGKVGDENWNYVQDAIKSVSDDLDNKILCEDY